MFILVDIINKFYQISFISEEIFLQLFHFLLHILLAFLS